jgi:hypothetical protein
MHHITEWRTSDAMESDRKLIAHGDDARLHTARLSVEFFQDSQMKRHCILHIHAMLLHLMSIFLGMSKEASPFAHSWIQRSFFEAVRGVLDSIENVILQAVFLEWLDRLRKCTQAIGEYAE